MIDYYEYLLKISWPALSGLFLIYGLLGIRLFQAVKNMVTQRNLLECRIVFARAVLTAAVLVIYTYMFTANYPDWLQRPVFSVGVVGSVTEKQGVAGPEYSLEAVCGEELITVSIDKNLYTHLREEDLIKFGYLSEKREVFSCTILTQQAERII